MPIITAAQLRAIAPRALDSVVNAIADHADDVFPKWKITTLPRLQALLSIFVEETGGLRLLTEDLQHYTALRIHEVWPSHFPTVQSAVPYAHDAKALADAVYGGRMGNTGPDDGANFLGRGPLQVTGRNNYALAQKLTGLSLLLDPELANAPEHMLEIACAIFANYSGVMAYADAEDWHAVWALVGSGRANGKIINLQAHEDALAHVQRVVTALPAVASAPVSAPAAPAEAPPRKPDNMTDATPAPVPEVIPPSSGVSPLHHSIAIGDFVEALLKGANVLADAGLEVGVGMLPAPFNIIAQIAGPTVLAGYVDGAFSKVEAEAQGAEIPVASQNVIVTTAIDAFNSQESTLAKYFAPLVGSAESWVQAHIAALAAKKGVKLASA